MKKSLWILLFFIAALYLLPLFFRPLTAPEEFRYAEIAREMLERRNFITTGVLSVPYFDTMPMSYWLTAASFKLFGFNTFALRIIPLLATLGSAFLLGLWCRKRNFSENTLVNVLFLYLSSCAVCAAGAFASAAALFAFWTTAVLVLSHLALESENLAARLRLLAGSGIALGCGFLTGGFQAVIFPLLAVAVYLLWQKRFKELCLGLFPPLAVGALIVLPWAIAAHKTEIAFWSYFFSHQHYLRFAECVAEHVKVPFWIVFPLFAAGFFPGIFPFLAALPALPKGAWQEIKSSPELRFSLAAASIPLLFLAIFTDDTLPSGILASFPPLAMAGAMVLDKTDSQRAYPLLRSLTLLTSVLFIIIGAGALLTVIVYLLWGTGIIPALPRKVALWVPFFITMALGLICSGTLLFINRKTKLPEPGAYFLLAPITMAVCVWFFPGFTASTRMPEYEILHIASQLSAEKIPHAQIIAAPSLKYPAAWCFKDSTIQLMGSAEELAYGHKYALAKGEHPLVLSVEEIKALLNDRKRQEGVLLLLEAEQLKDFTTGQLFTADGSLCALYFKGNKEEKKEK